MSLVLLMVDLSSVDRLSEKSDIQLKLAFHIQDLFYRNKKFKNNFTT
jgi:hypothetical protein